MGSLDPVVLDRGREPVTVDVILIDSGEVPRLGRAAVLAGLGLEVDAISWDWVPSVVAERLEGATDSPSLVIAALRPDCTTWDRYGALGSLAELVATMPATTRVVALAWGEALLNPLLGLRMVRAGIHRLVPGGEATDSAGLTRVVEDPKVGREPGPSRRDLTLAGVTASTDPDGVVAWVTEMMAGAADPTYYERAFEAAYNQKTCGLARRAAHNLRVQVTRRAAMAAPIGQGGGGPVRDFSLPRWNDVVEVANLCRGRHLDEHYLSAGPGSQGTGAPTPGRDKLVAVA